MTKLTPYLMCEDARAQANFYIESLGGEVLSVMTHKDIPGAEENAPDKVLHMAVTVAGVPLFLTDSFLSQQNGNALYLALEYQEDEEAHRAFDNLAVGAEIRQPLEKAFWGTLFGQLTDKYGVNWMITTEQKASQA
ncbi:VOC family protein [Paenibacillus herberti]|uniref:PhnB-like domain-containing protein n=1 Tax=Paenibacillus herberti TaxID=1619309 RepID=A0A229NUU1_9BACL|nr:VOC family protein [Paenibacillus herberti]OXM13389.1 hypothetical protein CGZ75_20215 [Paenibacillus herberti]